MDTKTRIDNMVLSLMTTFPIVFTLLFFGYLPVHYDIMLHVKDVEGEGICQSYGSPVDGRTTVNLVTFYFGSQLETATIKGYQCDVDKLYLVVSDVTSFDITEIDSYIWNIKVASIAPEDILPVGESLEGEKATLSSWENALHVNIKDPDEGTTITIEESFIPLWFRLLYSILIIILTAAFAMPLSMLYERYPFSKLPLLSVSCIVITILAGCFFCGSLGYASYVNFLLNWVFLFAAAMLINALSLPFFGTILTMAFVTIWYIANYFVITLRGKPIMPADLKAIGTAAEVMGGYTFVPDWKMVLSVVVVACYAAVLIVVWQHNKQQEREGIRRQLTRRCVAAGVAVLAMFVGINTSTFKNLNDFAWDATLMKSFHEEGMVLTYLKSALNSGVRVPEGYSQEAVRSYLAGYETNPNAEDNEIHPTRIIMVMNEAFSDLRGVGLDSQVDVMPFIDSLDQDVVEGSLFVSIFGGGTCNTEFEALTGNTLAFLGVGAYPYTEYVTEPVFSLGSYFREYGYITEAFHPNEANNWNRSIAYPNLGFERFHSIKDYENDLGELTYLHDLPADINDYLYIEKIDKENEGNPRFLFDVTMQNHSPYERWLDVERVETVQEYGSDLYVDTQVYLSLIKASDDELSQLVETYRESDEPTMIIFFGDHQPGLPAMSINELYTDVNSNLDLYKSKFFIWTNYDTQEWHDAGISANYLPWLILERGNFPLPPYVQMLKELYAEYPIISSQGVMDKEGNIYSGVAEVIDDPLIQKYQYVQYANLFDELDSAWFEVN